MQTRSLGFRVWVQHSLPNCNNEPLDCQYLAAVSKILLARNAPESVILWPPVLMCFFSVFVRYVIPVFPIGLFLGTRSPFGLVCFDFYKSYRPCLQQLLGKVPEVPIGYTVPFVTDSSLNVKGLTENILAVGMNNGMSSGS